MLGVVGTVPDPEFPLTCGPVELSGETLKIEGKTVPVNRGTPALAAAAVKAAQHLGKAGVFAFLAGDIGKGAGSRELYRFLEQNLPRFDFEVLTFHYLQPDVDWHNKVLFSVEAMAKKPVLIADAGFMYAAKMSGLSRTYDFFTPDVGELAFLADELAPHPFYTRGFILKQNNNMPELIRQAHAHKNAAVRLLVKGKTDYVVREGRVVETIDRPCFDAMEAIGGTGDTLTGLLTALCASGRGFTEAAKLAAGANRWTGHFARPTPATQVMDLIHNIPAALSKLL